MQKNEALKMNEERLNQQVAEMQSRIDALEFENYELKSRRSNGRSLLISDIMFEINYYQPSEQIHILFSAILGIPSAKPQYKCVRSILLV